MALNPPSAKTLAKYGLAAMQWNYILDMQDYKCAVCRRGFNKLRVYIDHQHARGFKNMQAVDKSRHVRGLLCFTCNRYRVAKNSLASARYVLDYLQRHADKLARLSAD